MPDRVLLLADGTAFRGNGHGPIEPCAGELVFTTSMSGYQEVATDPSYAGQIVVFTYPLIGNYGVNADDVESRTIQAAGVVCGEVCDQPSNWRSRSSFTDWLTESAAGISGIDTRTLATHLRRNGVMMGAIARSLAEAEAALENARDYGQRDLVAEVTATEPYCWGYGGSEEFNPSREGYKGVVAVLDCGLKYNILRRLVALGLKCLIYPCTMSADEILEHRPDGILISPGPGDPVRLDGVVSTVRELIGARPMFGICLGNQILCQAVGGSTFKLKFGHRGSNHPVKNLETGAVTITSQNHGYAVSPDSLVGTGAEVSEINLNDETVEGIRITGQDAESIQYHPEAAPGPWDARRRFEEFASRIIPE